MSHSSSLHSDGINFSFFHFLWNKATQKNKNLKNDSVSDNDHSSKDKNTGYIRIPDTIIFQFGQPLHWYFTSENRGQPTILRKRKQNLTVDKIEEVFLSKAKREGLIVGEGGGSDIVAYFISSVVSEERGGNNPADIEYFDWNGLHTFLAHGRKERTGLLQRFLPPLGPCNTVIRSIYTPKLCVLERRKNKLQLHDSRFGLYERAITFEGPDIHSTPSPLRGNILPTKIQALCDEVVEHVQNVTIGGRIIRMVANWKVDEKGKIWLLFTTCIRVEGSCRSKYAEFNSLYKGASSSQSLLNIEPMMKLPNAVHLEQNPNHDLSTGVNNYITTASCPSCCKNECETMFHPIPYKTIIAHFEQVLKMISREKEGETEVVLDWPPDPFIIKAAGGVGFGMIQDKFKKYDRDWDAEEVIIPPVMRYLHNRLKIEGYRKYRQDPLFLHKKCNVCEQCFLSYAELSSSNFQIADPIRLDGSGAIERRRKKRQQAIEMSRTHGEQLVGNKWIPMDEEKETTVFTKTFKKHFGEENGHARDFGDIPHFPDAIVSHSFDGKDITKHEYSDTSMQDFIKQRERIFFKEIALQGKHAIEGHALSHLISAQSTLEQSQRIGKKQNEKKEKNPYEEVLKFVDSTSSKVKKKENKWANKTRLPYPPLKSENNQQIDFSQKGI